MRQIIYIFLVLLTLSFNSHASSKADFSIEDDFSESSLRRGISATEEKCNSIPEKAIWSSVSSNLAECIKYWSYGLTTNTGKAIVYLHRNISATESAYLKLTGEMVSQYAVEWSRRVKAPYIFIGRPGFFGSSGDQSRKGLLEESQIISATLDGLKKKYGINEFVIAGLSGGGHTATSLLTFRDDIVCAVPTSAPTPSKIWYLKMGRSMDTTNHLSYEPTENFKNPVHKDLRVIILGDPKDEVVLWESQTILAEVLSKRGIPHMLLEGQGKGPQRHILDNAARDVASMCFFNKSFEEIKAMEPRLNG
jgi:hypothetical protein